MSIHVQLQHYLTHARDHERSSCNDTWQDEAAPEALQLRFSLAGGMFDAIRRSYQLTSDWAVLLTQLVAHQVVDAYNNTFVFFTVCMRCDEYKGICLFVPTPPEIKGVDYT